jgi:hypothetical protein
MKRVRIKVTHKITDNSHIKDATFFVAIFIELDDNIMIIVNILSHPLFELIVHKLHSQKFILVIQR